MVKPLSLLCFSLWLASCGPTLPAERVAQRQAMPSAPAPAALLRLDYNLEEILGSMPSELITRFLDAQWDSLHDCLAAHPAPVPPAAFLVSMIFDRGGAVVHSGMVPPPGDGFSECVLATMQRWTLPSSRSGMTHIRVRISVTAQRPASEP